MPNLYKSKLKKEGGGTQVIGPQGPITTWTSINLDNFIPVPFNNIYNQDDPYYNAPLYIVYQNTIHCLFQNGSRFPIGHFKLVNGEWVQASTLPIPSNAVLDKFNGGVVIWNNHLCILGCSTSNQAYEWDGTSWTATFTMPYKPTEIAYAVFENKLYVIGGTEWPPSDVTVTEYRVYYTYDGVGWTQHGQGPTMKITGNHFLYKGYRNGDEYYLVHSGGLHTYPGSSTPEATINQWIYYGNFQSWSTNGQSPYVWDENNPRFYWVYKDNANTYTFYYNTVTKGNQSFTTPFIMMDAIYFNNKCYVITGDFIAELETDYYNTQIVLF